MTAPEKAAGIRILPGAVEIDAAILAEGLGLAASLVPVLIRNGEITSLCERGGGDDGGGIV